MKKLKIVSADKMMVRAMGPVWHKRYKELGIVPRGLKGLDRDATWSTSKSKEWVYGHGTFSMVSHEYPVLGLFVWMRNSGNEAKKLWLESGRYRGMLRYVVMDSKADDESLYREFMRQRGMILVTGVDKNKARSEVRREMLERLSSPELRKIYRERSVRVEPMQGLVKEIFGLDRCWMRGDSNNRWIFAAMGLTVQMHQLKAYKEGRSPWKIKCEVLGIP